MRKYFRCFVITKNTAIIYMRVVTYSTGTISYRAELRSKQLCNLTSSAGPRTFWRSSFGAETF